MPQNVAEAAYLPTGNFRAERFSYRVQFLSGFADPFQASFHCIVDRMIFFESGFIIHARRVFFDPGYRFAGMSSKRCAGSLEGTHDLSLCASVHTRLQGSFFDQIDLAAEHFCKVQFHSNDIQQ